MEPDPRELQTPGQRVVSRLHRIFVGERPAGNYVLTRFVVLRVLGLVFVAAFASAVTQLVPLVGAHGITPMGPVDDFWARPTLFWWSASDAVLGTVSLIGLVLSIALLLGCENAFLLVVLWVLYLSIVHVGGRWIAVGTALRPSARAAPRTDPSERNYRTRLLPRVRSSKRSQGYG
ncbi:hypothetical protein OV203_43955 [Nannocystis sp. ILAH1]|nr:hypothetical protein [Nannocystis sp. ILAH1]MCY0994165.1 hypothetical protein [Nannocystis sp. ILAH1]